MVNSNADSAISPNTTQDKGQAEALLDEMQQKKKRTKGTIVFIVLLILLAFGIVLNLKLGAISMSWNDVFQSLTNSGSSQLSEIINNIRLPRIIVGILTGVNLALAGCILQGILRNPLADPGIIGITAGAGLAAMVIMIVLPTYVDLIPIGAFVGAMAASFLVYGISWNGGLNPLRLILAGVAIAAFFGGFNTTLTVFFPERVQGTVNWLAGGFTGRSWEDVWMILPYTFLGVIGASFSIHSLTLLSLGDDMARTLGLKVERSRMLLLLLAALLAASAVAVAGMLAFVGLIIPHVTRLLIGSDYNDLLPTAAVMGSVLIVYADLLARMILNPVELPVGILMSFIGAPFFLYLLKGVGRR